MPTKTAPMQRTAMNAPCTEIGIRCASGSVDSGAQKLTKLVMSGTEAAINQNSTAVLKVNIGLATLTFKAMRRRRRSPFETGLLIEGLIGLPKVAQMKLLQSMYQNMVASCRKTFAN